MACNSEDCKLEWTRFRKLVDEPIRVLRRPKAGEIETFDKDSEEWAVAKAWAKRWVEAGVKPVYHVIAAYACANSECICKPNETPNPMDDTRWGPWEEGDVAFVYTDDKGQETIVVRGEISQTTGSGSCRDERPHVVVPK